MLEAAAEGKSMMGFAEAGGELYGEQVGTCTVTLEALQLFLKDATPELESFSKWMDAQRSLLEEMDETSFSVFSDEESYVNCADSRDDHNHRNVSMNVWSFGARRLLFATCPGGASFGHGDVVWAAASFVSNCLQAEGGADRLGCPASPEMPPAAAELSTMPRPETRLSGLRVCELGAGAALPSLAAHWAGATVVATDAAVASRIAAITTSAALSCGELQVKLTINDEDYGASAAAAALGSDSAAAPTPGSAASRIFVRGHNWGDSCTELLRCACEEEGSGGAAFDLVIVCDCIYNPEYHDALIKSCDSLIRGDSGTPVVMNVWEVHRVYDGDAM